MTHFRVTAVAIAFALAATISGQADQASTSSQSEDQASQWVFVGPDGRLQYQTDDLGNQIMDFSYAGYGGGGVALPDVPVAQMVSPSGDDDTAAIQAAIDAVSALTPDANGFRGAVLLMAGSYAVSSTLAIKTSGVVLRGSGSGPDGSTLDMTGNPSPFLAIDIRGSGSWQAVGSPASLTDSCVPSGSRSFNVDDASAFSVGDTVLVYRPVTSDWVSFMGMDALVRGGQPQTWIRAGTQIRTDRVIAGIDGNQITLDAPLTDSFDSSLLNPPGGTIVKYTFASRISQVGLEHLSVLAPARDVTSAQYRAITMSNVIDGWIQDVAIQDTQNSVSIGGGTKRITLDTVSVVHSLSYSGAAGPADFAISGTQILLNQCSSSGNMGVWPFIAQAQVTGPVVLLNCSADSRGFAPHQRWATGLLADNCQFPGGGTGDKASIEFSDRGNFGSGHGWDAGWSVAWNVTGSTFVVQMPPGAANWCIGCVGRQISWNEPNEPPRPVPDGIFDSLGTPVTPSSLYLAQMCDRLGPEAVSNIGYAGACDVPPSNAGGR